MMTEHQDARRKISYAQEEYLLRAWPSPMPWEEILAHLNTIPGHKMNRLSMVSTACRLGVKRPGIFGGHKGKSPDEDYDVFTESCRWEDACDDAGVQFTDAPGLEHGDPQPPRVTWPQVNGPVTRGEANAHRMAMAIVDTARIGIGRVAA